MQFLKALSFVAVIAFFGSDRKQLTITKEKKNTNDEDWEKGVNWVTCATLETRRCKMGEKVNWRENGENKKSRGH